MKIDDIAVQIGPQLPFQQLTIASKTTQNLEDTFKYELFKYELCNYPPALFDPSLLLRESQKPVLANAIWGLVRSDIPRITGEVWYVLDGGALLQHIPWTGGAINHDLCSVYTDYVARKYGEAIIICVVYGGTSTEDMMHLR